MIDAPQAGKAGPVSLSTKFRDYFKSVPAQPAPAQPAAASTANKLTIPTVIVGFLILLIGLKFLAYLPKTELNPAHIYPGAYNFISAGIMVLMFLVLGKLLFARYHVPGVSEVFAFA